MKSSVNQALGIQTTTSSSSTSTSSVSTLVVKYYQKLDVQNGEVIGVDRKKPNPIRFRLVRSGWGRSVQVQRQAISGKLITTYDEGPYLPPNYSDLDVRYFTPDWSRVKNRAMEKVYSQLKGNSNLVVDLAEGGQTVKMVKSVLNLKKFIVTFMSEVVRHKKFRRIPRGPDMNQKRLDYVTGKWLEGRYGWQPLIYSIYDAADNLNRQVKNHVIKIKERSGQRIEQKYRLILKDSSASATRTDAIRDAVYSYRVEYGYLFNIPGGPKISDWTSLNPIGIAYELMTLSFVIDWVADIGGYLSLWENNRLFAKDFIYGYETTSYLEGYTYTTDASESFPFTYGPAGDLTGGRSTVRGASGFIKRTGMERVVLKVLPTPPGITVKVKFGWKHQLDSVALLHGFVGKKMRS